MLWPLFGRFKREEIKIHAWEDHQKAKIEAEMRKIEVSYFLPSNLSFARDRMLHLIRDAYVFFCFFFCLLYYYLLFTLRLPCCTCTRNNIHWKFVQLSIVHVIMDVCLTHVKLKLLCSPFFFPGV